MVYYEGIETEGEGQQLILSKLVEKYENLKAAQEEDFRLHPTRVRNLCYFSFGHELYLYRARAV